MLRSRVSITLDLAERSPTATILHRPDVHASHDKPAGKGVAIRDDRLLTSSSWSGPPDTGLRFSSQSRENLLRTPFHRKGIQELAHRGRVGRSLVDAVEASRQAVRVIGTKEQGVPLIQHFAV